MIITVAISSTDLSHKNNTAQPIRDAHSHSPGESDVDDGLDGNVDVDSVVVHRRQVLVV